jgi:hypothetical protein
LVRVALLWPLSCSPQPGPGGPDPNGAKPTDVVPDAADAADILPDAADAAAVSDLAAVAPDALALPYGWVKPRCDDSLVSTCAECPGKPFACEPCELSAKCVAECDAGCGGATACATAGTCVEGPTPCTDTTFCGCPPGTSDCPSEAGASCVASCASCPGMPRNFYGTCSESSGCLDTEGPEYVCSGGGSFQCVAGCDACGKAQCVSESCQGLHCERGRIPDLPYYVCGQTGCCEEGFQCPETGACVEECSACGQGYVGACGKGGFCVKSCNDCVEDPKGKQLQVCDGVCTDVLTNLWNCGACNVKCGGASDHAQCITGHCCLGSLFDAPPWSWCEACGCCVGSGWQCLATWCDVACVAP